MSGHGHVTPNADGTRARCGGPGLCAQCSLEQANLKRHKMEGVQVSEEEVSKGLGFETVDDFHFFQEHIDSVCELVGKSINRHFGDRQHSQIIFEIASNVTEYFRKLTK